MRPVLSRALPGRATAATGASPMRFLASRLAPLVLLTLAMIVVASAGYVVLADYSWFDALYMTVITFGTIGYGEVHELDRVGRMWTIIVIASGFCALVYAATVFTSLYVSGDLARVMRGQRRTKMRDHLSRHVIIVGFGRAGRATLSALTAEGRDCVVVDLDAGRAEEAEEMGAVAVVGDGRDEHALRNAGIDRASALIATAHDDATNLVVVVAARWLHPSLRIVARVNDETWYERLRRAGADSALSPYGSFGVSLASFAVESGVLGVQDLPSLDMRSEEIAVPAGSLAIGRTLRDLAAELPDVLLLGIRHVDGFRRWDEVSGALSEGDVLVALGPPEALAQITERLSASSTAR